MRLLTCMTVIVIGLTGCLPASQEKAETEVGDSTAIPENTQDSKAAASPYDRAFTKNGNVYVVTTGSISKQVTFSARDVYPMLDKEENKVFFFRELRFTEKRKAGLFKTETYTYNKYSLMSVELEKLTETVITDTKPFRSQEADGGIYLVKQPTQDPEGQHVYFITGKYATSNELVKVHLKTGRWSELFPAETFERIISKNYFGFFLVSRSEIGERGRDIYYRLISPEGNVVKAFDSKSSMNAFKSSQNIVTQNELNR